jgi:hypothetical protein
VLLPYVDLDFDQMLTVLGGNASRWADTAARKIAKIAKPTVETSG